MSTYDVYIHLHARLEGEDRDEVFDEALDLIAARDGMDIMKHEIIEVEDPTPSEEGEPPIGAAERFEGMPPR